VDEDGECPRTGLTKSGCAHCRGLDDKPRKRWISSDSGWFEAVYAGRCHNCGRPFEVNTLIKRIDDVYVAECCRYSS
jgi:hypothetical protein